MKSNFLKNVGTKFNRVAFKVKKGSPEILVIFGAVGVVASTVMACIATKEAVKVADGAKEDIAAIKEDLDSEKSQTEEHVAEKKKELRSVYIKTGLTFAKLYGPAVILGGLSLSSMIASNVILKKRNIGLAAAYAGLDSSFKDYRNRVVERFGEAVDKELKYNLQEETVVDKDGNEKKVHVVKESKTAGLEGYSDYARFFDASSREWEKDPEYNLTFLKMQQQHANDKLRARGYLFLNDVYDMLDIPRTKAGQVVGWIYDEKNPSGDNYVDFGIYNVSNPANRDFVNGYEPVIILDFNVDGDILDKM